MAETIETGVVVVKNVNVVEVFTAGGIKQILDRIAAEVECFVPDLSTGASRGEIASLAHKISKAKVVLDNLGKSLTYDWKQKAKLVDVSRKMARDFLDELRDTVRKPLSDWEEAEAARLAAEQLAEEVVEAAEVAYQENELFDRQREIERKEAELARLEEERKSKDLEAKQEREREEREEQIRKDAEAQAKREAEKRIQDEKDRADRAERERIAAEEHAKVEKEQAIQKVKEEAEAESKRKEEERLRLEAQEKAEAERVAAEEKRLAEDEAHRQGINNEVLSDLTDCTVLNPTQASGLIRMIILGKIRHVSIGY